MIVRSAILFPLLATFALGQTTGQTEDTIAPFLSSYCTKCHGEKKQKGKLALHDLPMEFTDSAQRERWRMITEQIRFLDMPPEDEKQPSDEERQRILAWIRSGLLETQQPGATPDPRSQLPEFGNHVDHEALFHTPPGPVIPGPPRFWRLRPELYDASTNSITEGVRGLSQPFSTHGGEGIQDYAALYFIDEPATDLLLRNAEEIILNQARHKRYGAIYNSLQPDALPEEVTMSNAITREFRMALRRDPTPGETSRFLKLWQANLASSGHPIGTQATLMAVLMLPEALFRSELGTGPLDELGRQRLSQQEIARAVNFALRDRLDEPLFAAADKGALATREEVAAQVQRLLDDPKHDNPRLLQFFREFFGYENAINVFKDKPTRGIHDARILVSDLEHLIQLILREDRDVLRTLLTTDQAYVNWGPDTKRGTAGPAIPWIGYETVYGLPADWQWTTEQPITLPTGERCGVLTHPAWLVAWSGNFDNHPVQRGKWIRTHLLGGSVPDVPIGVDARIPESEDLTLRQRLHSATSEPECWRCHKKMDPLGLPFEQFSHYGHFRNNELANPVNTTGYLDRTDDPTLDDIPLDDPFALLQHLATSERVEQVFVRHAFRFYLGRNETLGDAATLQEAWHAYRDNGGSYKALVTSLLTSDSFLYRMPKP